MDTSVADVGLRERKKRETRSAIHRAAISLVEDKGYAAVTTDEIAAAADVSPRTFFNYFAGKDAALIGSTPEDEAEIGRHMADRPADEPIFVSVRAVVLAMVNPAAKDPEWARRRKRLILSEPGLAPALIGTNRRREEALLAAVEKRLGSSPNVDLQARVYACAGIAALKAAIEHHQAGCAQGDLEDTINRAFDAVSAGLVPTESA